MKKTNQNLLWFQAILIVLGAIASIILLQNAFARGARILTILNGIIFVLVFIYVIIYTFVYHKKEDDKYFLYAVYAYAALLGIEILFAGNMMQGQGLSENLTLLVNIANLIAFANIVKTSSCLHDKKKTFYYMTIAITLKFAVEIYLIIISLSFIKPVHIITALAVPVLGVTLMIAYLQRYGE